MPLSEHEQKMLDEMERRLFADDPTLARAFDSAPRTRRDHRRIVIGILGVIAGLGLLVLAVALPMIWLGVIAFLLMLGGAIWAVTAPGIAADGAGSSGRAPSGSSRPSSGQTGGSTPFMKRMEDRWERRQDPGSGR